LFEDLDLNKEMLNDSKKITSRVREIIKSLPEHSSYEQLKNIVKTWQNTNIKNSKRKGSAEEKTFQ